jgi:dinuclear metal center YbgI/SA1388 family protein
MIDAFAPFDTATEGDNVGLLVGRMDRPVSRILTAIDVTPGLLHEAERICATLIVAHHPLLFTPTQRLDEAEPESALIAGMIRSGISFIAAHTNLDLAEGGVNDALLARLGLSAVTKEGFVSFGAFEHPIRLAELASRVERQLGARVSPYGAADRMLSRFASCCGSGGVEVGTAASLGADVFITGEIKYHQVLDALARGMSVIAAGHFETEICSADLLAKHLQSAANALQFELEVYISSVDPLK